MTNHTPKPIQIPLPLEGEIIKIPLTRGYVAIVDAIDADLLAFKWYTLNGKHSERVRAIRHLNKKTIHLSRIILERVIGRDLSSVELADHIDGNTLNNVRSNLRVASHTENMRNRKKRKESKLPYKGIEKDHNRWRARISFNGKRIHIGHYMTPEEAYEAYKAKARELFGEFARFD